MSGSRLGGWRVAFRLARREARRRKGQTLLMLVLICLPVLAVSAAAVVWQTSEVSSAEGVDRRIGSAAAQVRILDSVIVQHFDPEVSSAWLQKRAGARPTIDEVTAVLGGDRSVTRVAHGSAPFETERGIGNAEYTEVDLGDPLADGLVRGVSGKFPPGPGEVVVNRALADRGPGVGDELTVPWKEYGGEGRTVSLRIVGIAESTTVRSYPFAAAMPGAFASPEESSPSWLLGGGEVDWAQVRKLNALGVEVTSRSVLTDPPPASELPVELLGTDEGLDDLTLTVLGLVVVMVLIEVVLLAGPAFAVRAKGQAHTLALVAATGGTPAQARRTVLASGVLIGLVGGLLGAGVGIGVGSAAVPLVQRFDDSWFGPIDVPWLLLGLVAGFGLVSALLAAGVPAVLASRQDVVAVLAGRRGEGRPSARSPFVGLALIGLGAAGAVVGSAQGGGQPVLLGGAAILSVLGMILLVPVVVASIARGAAHLPLPVRFAARDAARHRTRTVPAVAAVGATVAGVVALGIGVTSDEAGNRRDYRAQLPHGFASVGMSPGADVGEITAALTARLPDNEVEPVIGVPPGDQGLELRFLDGGEDLWSEYWGSLGSAYLVADEVPDYLGVGEADHDRARRVLADGGVALLRAADGPRLDADRMTVTVNAWGPEDGEPAEVGRAEVSGLAVTVDQEMPPALAVLSPAAAKELDLPVATTGLVLSGPISTAAEQDLEEALATLPSSPLLYVERGYQAPAETRIIQLVLGALGAVLMLGGTLTATFLALSDARPDLATMAAVGARPRTRRGIAASYALVIGLVGAALGSVIGFIPGLAVSRPLTRDLQTGATVLGVPWLLLGIVVLGLPLLTAAAVGLCARSRLPMVARVE